MKAFDNKIVEMNKLLIQKDIGMNKNTIVNYYKGLPHLEVFHNDYGNLLVDSE